MPRRNSIDNRPVLMSRAALLLLIGVLISPQAADAQIGTIPLLDSLPTAGKCERFAGNAELKRIGDARMMTFSGAHPSRSITVGVEDRKSTRLNSSHLG